MKDTTEAEYYKDGCLKRYTYIPHPENIPQYQEKLHLAQEKKLYWKHSNSIISPIMHLHYKYKVKDCELRLEPLHMTFSHIHPCIKKKYRSLH